MKKHILFLMLIISSVAVAQRPARVPAKPTPIEITQPNGEPLTIRLFGDEWKHYTTTTDGFLIVQNEKNVYCYAKIGKDGVFLPSKYQAHNADTRSKCEQKFLKKQAKNEKLKKVVND
ncbi:MAG: hypothetical protein LBN95_02430 [Prevotellaceae bacterium]|nr:hypothetical protein [Prevotellaceae bacterium]